jgi:16S rRNA (guanine527-N7)-methyltransferase
VKRARSRPEAAPAPAAIAEGARELGVPLSDAQAGQLSRFAALLTRWNAVHNLTAIGDAGGVLTHHLLDSLSIVPSIAAIAQHPRSTILDVGAGGGLPGIVLAVARRDWQVTLVDKVQKKVAFTTQAKLELGLDNVDALHARVEDVVGAFDVIVSRAFAALPQFVGVTRHLLRPTGHWAAMKGVRPDAELVALQAEQPDVRVVDIAKLAIPRLGAERHLILLQPR